MLNLSNAKKWNKTTIHKAIITIFIIILLLCPAPTGKLRQYTTSILGKITLIVVTIAVICYDPIIGILAIILLLKCSGSGNGGMIISKKAGKEGFTGDDDGEKPTDSKRMQFINEHCTCKNMYNKDTGLLKPKSNYKDLCKRAKTDTPEDKYYETGQLWNRVPNFAIRDPIHAYDLADRGKKSKEYEANRDEWKKNEQENGNVKPHHLLMSNFAWMTVISNSEVFGKMSGKGPDDKNTLSKIRFTGQPCNPCNLESCTNWELVDGGGSSMGSFGGSSKKDDKKNKDKDKQSFGDKLAALFD